MFSFLTVRFRSNGPCGPRGGCRGPCFARAAARLGIEQSRLSRQIRDLEEEVGVSLFERTTRSTRLTFAGGVFLRDARHILANVEIAAHSAREAASGRNGRLSLSTADGLTSMHVSGCS